APPPDRQKLSAAALLAVLAPASLSLLAAPVMAFTDATAQQLRSPQGYIAAVLGDEGRIAVAASGGERE
ncbi:MAG TPA: hypothetical protein VIQ22_02870, partial [Gammaproteobacteria bacterium]